MHNPQKDTAEKKLKDLSHKLALLESSIEVCERLMAKHAKRAEWHGNRNNPERLLKLTNLVQRYADRATTQRAKRRRMRATITAVKRNLQAAGRLDTIAAARAAPGIMRKALQQAKAAQEKATIANLSPKEARKRLRAVEHEENRKEKAARQKASRYAAAGVDPDARLANGTRDIEISGIGKDTRAVVSGLHAVLRSSGERIPSRIQAWERFDRECDKACSGLMGGMNFDAPVQGSVSTEIPTSRLEACQQMATLARHIGLDGWGLLYAFIFMRKSFAELKEAGAGERQELSARFRAALDGAAAFWGMTDDFAVGREARRILTCFDEEARQSRRSA